MNQDQENKLQKYSPHRNQWLQSDDGKLIAFCSAEGFQTSGPGGQKRNRKFSAIRITHKSTGIFVVSTETRSQSDNRRIALKKIRLKLAVEIRGPEVSLDRLKIGLSNSEYPLWIALLFDRLWNFKFSISKTANSLHTSTAQLIKLIARDPSIWKIVNEKREHFGLKKLKHF